MVTEEGFFFRSCECLNTFFKLMFSNIVSEKFALSIEKKSNAEIVKTPLALYSLVINETTSSQVLKQMSFLVRYGNVENNETVTRYVTLKFFCHATTVDLTIYVMK